MSYPNLGPMRPIVNVHWPIVQSGRGLATMSWGVSRAIGGPQSCFPPSTSIPCAGAYHNLWTSRVTVNFSPSGGKYPTPPPPVNFGPFEVPLPEHGGFISYEDPAPVGESIDGPNINIDNPGAWIATTVRSMAVDSQFIFGASFCEKLIGFNYRENRCIDPGVVEVIRFDIDVSNVTATSLDGSTLRAFATMVPTDVPSPIFILLQKED